MIEYINQTKSTHIITIEDPIEYTYVGKKALIHQRETGQDVISFASALRSALRETRISSWWERCGTTRPYLLH